MNKDKKKEKQYVVLDSVPDVGEDEIDLLELIRTLLQSWKLIFGITILSVVAAVVYAFSLPEVYQAETMLVPAREEKNTASTLSQLGGLAVMAGITIPVDSNVEQVVATLQSGKFLRFYIEKNELLPVLFEESWDLEKQEWRVNDQDPKPTVAEAVSTFKGLMNIDRDKKAGLITLGVSWKDPELAAVWANDLVKQLNKQLREKAISDSRKRVGYLEQELAKTTLKDMQEVLYKLLESEKQKAMLANVNEDFALEVIDPATIPKVREKPKRKLIVIIGSICGGFLGVFTVFFLQFLRKLKNTPSQTSSEDA